MADTPGGEQRKRKNPADGGSKQRPMRDHRSEGDKAKFAGAKRGKFDGGSKGGDRSGGEHRSMNRAPGGGVPNPHNKPLSKDEKAERNRRKKLKRRKQQQKSAPSSDSCAAKGPARDYAADLEEYLNEWRDRSAPGSEWKFNKKLQTYCIQNFLKASMVSDYLYIAMMPYLMSIEGKGLARIEELCDECLAVADAQEAEQARARQIKDIVLQCK